MFQSKRNWYAVPEPRERFLQLDALGQRKCPEGWTILSSLPGPLAFLLKEVGLSTNFPTDALIRISPQVWKRLLGVHPQL